MKLERKVRLCSAAAAVLIAAIALTGCGGCFYRCCHQQQLRRGRDLGTG